MKAPVASFHKSGEPVKALQGCFSYPGSLLQISILVSLRLYP